MRGWGSRWWPSRGRIRGWLAGGWWRCGWWPCRCLPCRRWLLGRWPRRLPRRWLLSDPSIQALGRGGGIADLRRRLGFGGAGGWNLLVALERELDADLGERILRPLGCWPRKPALEELADDVQGLRASGARHRRCGLELRDRLTHELVDVLGGLGCLTQPALCEAHEKLRVPDRVPLDRERQALGGALQSVERIARQRLLCRVGDSPREGQRRGDRGRHHSDATSQAQEWSHAP